MTILDWSEPRHHSPKSAPCRICRFPTNLLDSAGRPAHKVCVERLINDPQLADFFNRKETLA